METTPTLKEVGTEQVDRDHEMEKVLQIVDERIREILSKVQVTTFTEGGRIYEIKNAQERAVAEAEAMLSACSKVLAEIRNSNENSKEHYLLEKATARLEGRLRLHKELARYDAGLTSSERSAVLSIIDHAVTAANVEAANDAKYAVEKAA